MNLVVEILLTLATILYSYIEALVKLFIPKSAKSVRDKVALITGGAKGIGREVALRLAEQGAKLVIIDVDEDANKQTSDDIRGIGSDVHTYVCDVSNRDDVAKTAALVRRDVGDVDMLFNNAGICIVKRITDLSERDIRRTMDINVIAHFWMIQEFLPSMMSRNEGHVITTCSISGCSGAALLTDYTASKFAVRGLTDALEMEVLSQGVTGLKFTNVYPSFTNTNLVRDISHRTHVVDRFGELLSPAYVGEAIVAGVLRDKRHIFIPRIGFFLDYLNTLVPNRGVKALAKFFDIHFAMKE